MSLTALTVFLASGLAGGAEALAMRAEGWTPVSVAALAGSPDDGVRRADPNGYLKAEGDFDGDGREDSARLMQSGDELRYGLVVELSSRCRAPMLLADGPRSDHPRIGVDEVPRGEYVTACSRGHGRASDCTIRSLRVEHVGIELFTFEASTTYFAWNGREFVEAAISD